MKCSKVFSGDLPELTSEIMQYFRNDYKTLHSCILVNRLWCRLAIPLLWEDPFSIPTENYHFIKIYLNNLNYDDKTKLKEYGIENDLFPLLFNYPNFIKYLNALKLFFSIENWIMKVNRKLLDFEDFTRLIYKLLFKLFIENDAKLHTLEFTLISDLHDDNVIELILRNPNFIRNIENLKLTNSSIIEPFLAFLSILSSNCNSISELHFEFAKYNVTDKMLVNVHSSEMIKSQKNLKQISFEKIGFPLNNSLLSLKNSNCINTLKTIIFYNVDFLNYSNMDILGKVFEQLNVLESFHILYCYFDLDFIHQIINNTTKLAKLKSLFMDEILQIDLLQLLLQKTGNYLENIGCGSKTNNESKQKLFELVLRYCAKIKFFDLQGFDDRNLCLVLDFIENTKQNLNYLSINFCKFFNYNYGYHNNSRFNDDTEISSIVLRNLGRTLPLKLEYLNLSLKVSSNDLKVFLNHSQNTFIKKLLIRNKMQEGDDDDILPYIKEHIMKKKRVEYLAIEEVLFLGGKDLFYLKDEVKEFELYDIKVLKYNDLCIKAIDYIKEVY